LWAWEGELLRNVQGEIENAELTISQMSRLYSVTLRTLRFYEDRGLLTPRREGNARFYRAADRARVEMILRGKKSSALR
jgi:DNA-binding transcriptional MerR regulator